MIERCSGGELFDYVQKYGQQKEDKATSIIHQILQAVAYMHEKRYGHFDLKPENVMFKTRKYKEVKLIDFGMAKPAGEQHFLFLGTPDTMAPEIIETGSYSPGIGYTEAVDIWAIGCIAYEIVVGHPPFYSQDHSIMYSKTLAGFKTTHINALKRRGMSAKYIKFIEYCLTFSKSAGWEKNYGRKTAAELLRHDIFTPLNPQRANLQFKEGQKVEIYYRDGRVAGWYPGIVRRKGKQSNIYAVRYDDGYPRWVSAADIRDIPGEDTEVVTETTTESVSTTDETNETFIEQEIVDTEVLTETISANKYHLRMLVPRLNQSLSPTQKLTIQVVPTGFQTKAGVLQFIKNRSISLLRSVDSKMEKLRNHAKCLMKKRCCKILHKTGNNSTTKMHI